MPAGELRQRALPPGHGEEVGDHEYERAAPDGAQISFADVGEVHAVAAKERAVVALKPPIQTADDRPLEPPQSLVRRAQRRVPASVPPAPGCARAPCG